MTLAFDVFLEQFHLNGPDRADGYETFMFTGLDDDEKDVAFALLVRQLPWAADRLFQLDPVKALVVARELEPGLRARAGVHLLQREIVRYAGDLRYQMHMVEDYAACADADRAELVASIASTPATRATIDFFKWVMRHETDRRAVAAAGRPLLFALKLPRATLADDARFRELERQLGSADVDDRLAALDAIAAYEASAEHALRWSTDPATLLDRLAHALQALQAAAPNGHTRRIGGARSFGAWYDAVHALWSATGSNELRDGADDRVHLLCEEVRDVLVAIEPAFTTRLLPASPRQWREWGRRRESLLDGRGWVDVHLPDARLLGSELHVRRVLREDGTERGVWPDFKLPVEPAQADLLRERFDRCRAMREAVLRTLPADT